MTHIHRLDSACNKNKKTTIGIIKFSLLKDLLMYSITYEGNDQI